MANKASPLLLSGDQLSQSYQRAANTIQTPPQQERQHRDLGTKREDEYRSFRTWLVLSWVLCNGLLVAVVSSSTVSIMLTGDGDPNKTNPYMAILMYSVVLFTLVRFMGAIGYLIHRRTNK
jgi:chitin synthase